MERQTLEKKTSLLSKACWRGGGMETGPNNHSPTHTQKHAHTHTDMHALGSKIRDLKSWRGSRGFISCFKQMMTDCHWKE